MTLPPLAALRGTLGSCPRCFRLPFLAVSQSRSVSFPVPRREGNFSLYQKWMGFFWSSERGLVGALHFPGCSFSQV